jgi:hypothetical protein
MADNNQTTGPTPPPQRTEAARIEVLIRRLAELEAELRKTRAELVSIHNALAIGKGKR